MDLLYEICRAGTEPAVDRLIHERRRDEFHDRFPKGQCPLCAPLQNALARSPFAEKLQGVLVSLQT